MGTRARETVDCFKGWYGGLGTEEDMQIEAGKLHGTMCHDVVTDARAIAQTFSLAVVLAMGPRTVEGRGQLECRSRHMDKRCHLSFRKPKNKHGRIRNQQGK